MDEVARVTATFGPGGWSYGRPGPGCAPGEVSPRGRVLGRSAAATGRLQNKLAAIDWERELRRGCGVSLTLTKRFPLATPALTKSLREAWWRQCRRDIPVLAWALWVMEFQSPRDVGGGVVCGVDHDHVLAWFDFPSVASALEREAAARDVARRCLAVWLRLANLRGCDVLSVGQHGEPVTDARSLAVYLVKHHARGGKHEQLSISRMPAGWREFGSSGRTYGVLGRKHGPAMVADRLELDESLLVVLRRRVMSPMLRADAAGVLRRRVRWVRTATPYCPDLLRRWMPRVREAAAVRACRELGRPLGVPGLSPLDQVSRREWMARVPKRLRGSVRVALSLEAARRPVSYARRWLSHPPGGWFEVVDEATGELRDKPSRAVANRELVRGNPREVSRRMLGELYGEAVRRMLAVDDERREASARRSRARVGL